ncbi:esterase family protein [Xylanibacillus composti]|uniref:Esterase family protein n=1 Tax=Xylanibacillus composti TaxID=1572762 RepID=A0A8J4H0R8_9BACL|nr:alpha/beta hydrolase-fold protein [Xylanibacillus composti]MDT9725049.1 esterase family protein [Xylanibacillus composti]GIQ67471.1 hypothetical protein XYCOK13_02950 [Xylanibacillus composti]
MHDPRYYKRTIEKRTLPSAVLGEERLVRVYLPPGYNDLLSYPVVYCQDGEEFFQFGRIATHANRMILDEGVEPFLIAGVAVDVKKRTSEYAPEGERFSAYQQFFTQELIPFLEDEYPVRSAPGQRILAGDSLGGTISLHLALDYPDLFHNVLALSGAFLPSTQERIRKETDLAWLRLYMLIGLDEQEVKTERGTFDFLEANRTARALLEERRTVLQYEEKPGKHLWGFWQDHLPTGLKLLLPD